MNIVSFAVTLLFASFIYWLNAVSTTKNNYYFSIAVLFLLFIFADHYYISKASTFNEQELVPVRTATSSKYHLPAWVQINKLDRDGAIGGRVTVTKGEGSAEVLSWKSAERVIDIEAGQPLIARIRTFNFPGWTAYIDDQPTGIITETGTGAMLIRVAKGKHRLKLFFNDTPVRFYGKVISFFSLLLLSAILLCGSFRKAETRS